MLSSTAAKGKSPAKSKISASTSRIPDEELEMLDAEYRNGDINDKLPLDEPAKQSHEKLSESIAHDGFDHALEEPAPGDEDREDDDAENRTGPDSSNSNSGGANHGAFDEAAAAMAIFGDYRHIGSYMLSQSSRLKTLLNNIKSSAEPTTRLLALQELSEILSISTEDSLAGSFQVESFVRELVRILGGQGAEDDDEDEDGDQEVHGQDEDAALAAALSMSGGGFQGDENLEAQVLACRCLANLMEALPGVAHTVVYHGAIPVLCSKLIEISYIDLAEQTLSVSNIAYGSLISSSHYEYRH